MVFVQGLFWIAIALIAYTYLLFPLLIALRGTFFRRPIQSDPITPYISLIIAAHNEQDSIGSKIENVLQLDYPAHKLQVVIASDGSTDRTCQIVSQFTSSGVRLLDLPRLGKANALNEAVAQAEGEILVFSDANSMYGRDALRELVAPLADRRVGGVAGDQRYEKPSQSDSDPGENEGEHAYWNFDRLLKRWESQAGNVISATGAIYAIRRKLFQSVPDGVTDDFVTSTRVILQGYRLVFAENAAAYEPVAASRGIEFGRKVRVMTRGLRGVQTVRQLLNPRKFGFYAIQLLSHKVLRRLMVIPLIILFLTSLLLATHGPLYLAMAVVQSAFYSAAFVGYLGQHKLPRRLKLLSFPTYFCMVNLAALVALCHTLRGRRIDRWEPQRNSDTSAALTSSP